MVLFHLGRYPGIEGLLQCGDGVKQPNEVISAEGDHDSIVVEAADRF